MFYGFRRIFSHAVPAVDRAAAQIGSPWPPTRKPIAVTAAGNIVRCPTGTVSSTARREMEFVVIERSPRSHVDTTSGLGAFGRARVTASVRQPG